MKILHEGDVSISVLFMVMCVAVTGLRRGLVLLPYLQAADRTDQFPADLLLFTVPVNTHPPVIAELL